MVSFGGVWEGSIESIHIPTLDLSIYKTGAKVNKFLDKILALKVVTAESPSVIPCPQLISSDLGLLPLAPLS
jgi:hypothetical protein